MNTTASRLLWMALQGAIIVAVVAWEISSAADRGEPSRPGLAFLLGCGAAIIVTTLLSKAWDLSRAAVVRRREISVAKVALASAYCAALPFAVMAGERLQAGGHTGAAIALYAALFGIIPAWVWIDRGERRASGQRERHAAFADEPGRFRVGPHQGARSERLADPEL